jgi:hypothetical protein
MKMLARRVAMMYCMYSSYMMDLLNCEMTIIPNTARPMIQPYLSVNRVIERMVNSFKSSNPGGSKRTKPQKPKTQKQVSAPDVKFQGP